MTSVPMNRDSDEVPPNSELAPAPPPVVPATVSPSPLLVSAAALPSAPPPATVNTNTINVSVASAPAAPIVIMPPNTGPSLIVRALWYVFIGWWLSAVVIVLGYGLLVVSLGLAFPISFALFNRVPQALTLRPRRLEYHVETTNGVTQITMRTAQQIAWYWRLLYFPIGILVGAFWVVIAWVLTVMPFTWPLTMPLGIWMLDQTSTVITLQRH